MDDILLLDAIERYRKGEMTPQERTFFEELRKNNPEIDQVAAEHTFFLQELDNLGEMKAFKQSLNEVENDLMNEGIVAKRQLRGKSKVVYLWNRYRRTIAVAASIAGIVSILTAGLVSVYSDKKKDNSIQYLSSVVAKTQRDVDILKQNATTRYPQQDHAIAEKKPPFKALISATGFLIDPSGYIATSAHVINNANNIIIENKKGDQYYADLVYVNKGNDLAILKISDTSFKRTTKLPYLIPKNTADLGAQIFTLGFPREVVVYGEGYLSAKSGFSGDTTSYQISVSVNPGNSGGPVFNKNGEVIGIISSKETNADGVVFAVKSKNIYAALDEIKANQSIKLPAGTNLKGMEREQQIKKIEDCVFKVKTN